MKSLFTVLNDSDIKRAVDTLRRASVPAEYVAFPSPHVEKFRSQWQDLVGRFTDSYNKSTTSKFFYTEKRMAMKLSPILKREGIEYLEYFYEECRKKDNFGRWMNYSLNPKNIK